MAKVAGPGKFGSVKAIKDAVKSGGPSLLYRLKPEESITVRFLEEPDEWFGCYQHYYEGKFVWCKEGKCEACEERIARPLRYIANAVIFPEGKVIALQMTQTLAELLIKSYEKRNTIMDCDYELSREGASQLDTTYYAEREDPVKRNLAKFKLYDISSLVESEMGESSPDEEEEPRSTKRRHGGGHEEFAPRGRRYPEEKDDDEDEYEDFDDEEEDELPRRTVKRKSSTTTSRSNIKRTVRRTR